MPIVKLRKALKNKTISHNIRFFEVNREFNHDKGEYDEFFSQHVLAFFTLNCEFEQKCVRCKFFKGIKNVEVEVDPHFSKKDLRLVTVSINCEYSRDKYWKIQFNNGEIRKVICNLLISGNYANLTDINKSSKTISLIPLSSVVEFTPIDVDFSLINRKNIGV